MTVTNTTANAILDLLLGAGSNTVAPATYYVGMSTTAPNSDGTGATEPTGGGYARVAYANNSTNFATAATGRTKSNSTVITFPQATANWGTISHWLLYDAATGGNLLNYGVFSASQAVNSGNTPDIAIGGLVVSLATAV